MLERRVRAKMESSYVRLVRQTVLTSNCTQNTMTITKHKCKYVFCNYPVFPPTLKEDKILVGMSLKTIEGFLKGHLPHYDTVDFNYSATFS